MVYGTIAQRPMVNNHHGMRQKKRQRERTHNIHRRTTTVPRIII